MSTLVTGASGFVGRRVMQDDYIAMVRKPAGFRNQVFADLTDGESLNRACREVSTVIHCAGYAHAFSKENPEIHHAVNVLGTKALVEAAARSGVGKFIFLSSVKAQAEPGENCVDEDWPGQPRTAYGSAKRMAEDIVLQAGASAGMHVVILRLAMVYGRGGRGNLERLARAMDDGWFPDLPDVGNRRSLVHVNDVVSAVQTVANRHEANGRIYIVAHPEPHSTGQLCKAIRRMRGGTGGLWQVPVWTLRAGGKVGDMAGRILAKPMPFNSENASRLLDSEWYSPARIQRELGWEASVSLLDGLTEMLSPSTQN